MGQEINRPYHRPPLSKAFLRGEKSHEELFTHPSHDYTKELLETTPSLVS